MKRNINKAMPGIDLGNGWVKAKRNWAQAKELMAKSRNALCLLYLIALRAWRGPGINQHGCGIGEGFIGDFAEWGLTKMEYRIAKRQLEKFGFASFRTTNRGTIAKLSGPEIFDINVELGVTDRAAQHSGSTQAALRQHSSSTQAALGQHSDSTQAAPNKKSRSQEAKKSEIKEINNTNNAAGAGGGGGVLPAAGGAVAPGEEEGVEEAPPAPAPVGDMPGAYVEMTPGQKASKLAMELPLYIKCVAKLNQRPTFTASTLEGALEWFQRNTDHEWFDIQAICALGIKNAREIAVPEDGFDPHFWSRKYAHKPNKLFETNADGDMILALILGEGKWAPDAEHDAEWASKLTQDEVRLALGKPK